MGYNSKADKKINEVVQDIEEFEDNYEGDGDINEEKEYQDLLKRKMELYTEAGYSKEMMLYDDEDNFIGIDKRWQWNEDEGKWINIETEEEIIPTVNESEAIKQAELNDRQNLEQMYVNSVLKVNTLVNQMYETGDDRYMEQFEATFKYPLYSPDFKKTDPIKEAAIKGSIFLEDNPLPYFPADSEGLVGEYNKALREMATLYRAMQLNINPALDDSNHVGNEIWTHVKRKSFIHNIFQDDKIIGDEAADTFEQFFLEDEIGSEYVLGMDPDDRESKSRQYLETISKGVVDIGELGIAVLVGNRAMGLTKISNMLQKGYQASKAYRNRSKFTKLMLNTTFNANKTFIEWSAGEALWTAATGNDLQQTFYWDGEKGEYVIHPYAPWAMGGGMTLYTAGRKYLHNMMVRKSPDFYRRLNTYTPSLIKEAGNTLGAGATPALLLVNGEIANQFISTGTINLESQYDANGNLIQASIFGPDGYKSLGESITMFATYHLTKGRGVPFYKAAKKDIFKLKGVDINQQNHQKVLKIDNKNRDKDGIIDSDVIDNSSKIEIEKVEQEIIKTEQNEKLSVEEKGSKITELENKILEIKKSTEMLHTYNVVNEARAIARADNKYEDYLQKEFLETNAFEQLRTGVENMTPEALEKIGSRYGLGPDGLAVIYEKLGIKPDSQTAQYYDFVVQQIQQGVSRLDVLGIPKTTKKGKKARADYLKNVHELGFNQMKIQELQANSKENSNNKEKNDLQIKKIKESNKELLEKLENVENNFHKDFKQKLKRENDYLKEVVEGQGKDYKTSNTKKFKENVEKEGGSWEEGMGAFISKDGRRIYVDKQFAYKVKSLGKGIHEVAHMLLIDSFKTTNKEGNRVLTKEGIAAIDVMLDLLPGGRYGEAFEMLKEDIDLNYRYEVDVNATTKSILTGTNKVIFKKDKNGKRIEKPKEEYYEEYVGKLVEFIKDGKIKSSSDLGSRIGRAFYPILKKTFPKLYNFEINQSNSKKAGKDMMNFVNWLTTIGPTKNLFDISTGGKTASRTNTITQSRDINNQISKLKKGSDVIVERNTAIYDALVKRAQDKFGANWKKILDSNTKENKIKQKEFVEETSELRNAIVKNNENVAHWMATHPKYGGKGEYSGITGDILVGKGSFFEKFENELYELSRSYNPAKNNSPGAYLFETIRYRYPGIMEQLAPGTKTKSLTTEDGKIIDIKDLANYEQFEDLNILEVELKNYRKIEFNKKAKNEILQSKLRKEIGIETEAQKEEVFDQVKKDLQITKSPIGITAKSFLTSLKKVTENSHYDILDKSLTTEKMIELKDVILESIPISELVQMGKFLPQGNIFVKTHSHPTKTKWGAEVEVKEFMGIRPEGGFKFNNSGKNLLPEMKNLFDVFSKMPQEQQKASAEYKEFKKKLKVGFPKIYERLDVGLNEWKAFVEGTTKGKRQTADKSGTKGNNRTSLIKKLSTSLTKDAIPELLEKNKDFVDRYMDVKGLKENIEAKALVEKFINNIGRQQGLQFSKDVKSSVEKAREERREMINEGEQSIRNMFNIINAISKVGVQNVYDFSPVGEKFTYELKKEFKDLVSSTEAKFIFENLILENKVFNQEGNVRVEKILEGIPSRKNKRSLGFEQFIMNQFKGVKGIVLKTEFQTEVGDMADVPAEIAGRAFNVEVKMHNARLGSLTASLNMKNNTIGNITTKDFNKFRDKAQIESLLKESLKGWRKIRSYYKKLSNTEGISTRDKVLLKNFNKHNDAIPDWAFQSALKAGLYNAARSKGVFKETLIEDMYMLKTNPSEYMLWLGRGLMHLGNKNSFGLETTKLEGEFFGSWGHSKRSIKSATTKHEAFITKKNPLGKIDANGLVTASLRFIPTAKNVTSKNSKIDVTSAKGLETFNNSIKRATEIIKANTKSQNQIQASKSLKNVIDYAVGKKKIRGGSVFDFDHTVAVTKSGVKARVPNTDGTPKPKRKVIFLAGGAGSGKGNVIKKLNLEKDGFKIVNSDISLEWLKKNHGLPENMRDLTSEQRSTLGKLGHQARQIAKRKMMKFQGNADGVVIDGTGGSIRTMEKLVKEFKDKGYDTSMLFVETSLKTALERNRNRKERSLLDKIVERNHEAVQKNKEGFKEMFGGTFMEVKTDNLTMKSPMPKELVTKMSEFVRGYENMRLDAEQFASQGEAIKKRGGEFDFSEFNKVVEGSPGPFLEKLRERVNEFGNKDVFILTARPSQSAVAIKEFLKGQGIDIPIENITGLGNSTGNAKAKWMLEKYAEGYNDLYFVDDALQNVKAVKKVLEQLDIKSKVVQAKLQFSKDLNKTFNEIIERKSKGKFKADKEMSLAEARILGKAKGRFDFFVPASAEDMKGLIYKLLGKGEQGNKDMRFFKKALFDPFAKGTRDLTIVKQKMASEYKELKKKSKNIKLNKTIKGTPYTVDAAIRMYLWGKAGYDVPGISKSEQKMLTDYVKSRPDLISFAETLSSISRVKEGYEKPGEYWMVETIGSDLNNITSNRARKDFLHEWIENKNIIFSKQNLNKLEATFGKSYREALENMLTRMELGTNRLHGIKDGPTKWWYDWINGSVGATMFWNTRSALLQTISMANFTNHADNNIFIQARNFANQKQFWKDFAMLYNSPMLKQRRAGLEIDVSASEIQNMFQKSGRNPKAILRYMLEKGFTPTRMADSFAIAMGGASFYRQKFKKYKKQGLSDAKAKEKAMLEFQEVAEETQQSSRPDLISQQQAGPLGRLILAWQNTPMQMTRLMKKSLSDVVNRRKIEGQSQIQSDMSNISRIIYYGAIQNIWFATLQSGLMWMLFGSDLDEDMEKKERSILNSAFDTLLRGTGVYGAAISTGKNVFMKYKEEQDNPFWKQDFGNVAVEAINLSPPLGSKVRKVYSAIKGWGKFKAAEIGDEMGLRIDNPELMNIANIIEATTNIPLARLLNKSTNLEEAITCNHEWWQRLAMAAGWSRWNVGVKDEEVEAAKESIKEKKQEEKKEEKRKEKEEQKKKEEEEKKKKGIKTVRCSGIRSNGQRCKMTTETAEKTFLCVHHMEFTDGMDRDGDGIKEYRCTATKKNGERCKNKTENKNKKCYAHQ